MEGICGNMDGNKDNDWRECFTGVTHPKNTAASISAIAASCKDGDHDGQKYKGGTKLDSMANALGK